MSTQPLSLPLPQAGNQVRERLTVNAADTLYSLAEKYLGDSDAWRYLALFNQLGAFDSLPIGQSLTVPNEDDLKQIASAYAKSSITDLAETFLNNNRTAQRIINTAEDVVDVAISLQTVIDGKPNEKLLDLSDLKQFATDQIDSLISWLLP